MVIRWEDDLYDYMSEIPQKARDDIQERPPLKVLNPSFGGPLVFLGSS